MKLVFTSLSLIVAALLVGYVVLNTGESRVGDNNASSAGDSAILVLEDSADFERIIDESNVPVLIDFYADWCGPCRTQGQILHDMNLTTADTQIVKINVDHHKDIARQFNVQSIPTLLVFVNGEQVERHVGLASEKQVNNWIGL